MIHQKLEILESVNRESLTYQSSPMSSAPVRYLSGMWIALAAFLFVMVGAVQAAQPSEPDHFLQTFGDQAIGVIGDETLETEERKQAFSELLTTGFDMKTIAKLALGRHWRSASEADRDAYAAVFQDYVIETYERRLRAYSGQQIEVAGWKPVKRDALVSSQIVGSGTPIAVDWRLREGEDGWRILDIVVEGVSMLLTQRNEFASIVETRGGLEALIQHLAGAVETASIQ